MGAGKGCNLFRNGFVLLILTVTFLPLEMLNESRVNGTFQQFTLRGKKESNAEKVTLTVTCYSVFSPLKTVPRSL